MDKYLLNILHEVNTIIIPGLGALTVTNKATGEYMFMPYLKHDDGALAKHIAEKEGMDLNDAKNLIAKYVREIQAKLDTGDTYDMYQFGRFVKKDGDVDFEAWTTYQHSAEEDAPSTAQNSIEDTKVETSEEPKLVPTAIEEKVVSEVTSIPEEIAPVSTPPEETKSLDEILAKQEDSEQHAHVGKEIVPESQAEQKEEIKEEPSVELNEEAIIVQEASIDVTEIQPNENVYIPEDEVKEIAKKQEEEKKTTPKKTDKKSKSTAKPSKGPKEVHEKKKRSLLFWVMVVVIILLVGGGASYGVFYKEINARFFDSVEKVEQKEELAKTDENLEEIENQVELEQNHEEATNQAEETAEKAEESSKEAEELANQASEVKKETPALSGSSSGDFHIIAGGFGVESNAERMAKKYQAEGKNAQVLGKFDDLFLVSYESFSSKEEAASALKSSGIKGWIFKYHK